ncbi:hypothetical protein MRB53_019574 [Persea americana]|uniref:Uncharacterized protein n=1 Tax=Persea americana TaxID=3435 RepID=A0ACC2KZK2_PERAE|nr:hypothetical protein MRB53_019574 [Persea americana]
MSLYATLQSTPKVAGGLAISEDSRQKFDYQDYTIHLNCGVSPFRRYENTVAVDCLYSYCYIIFNAGRC